MNRQDHSSMTHLRDSHCSYCGTRFAAAAWPRTCTSCNNVSYRNPLPVAVLLLPVDDGLLVIRRGIEPGRGLLALPGGFIDVGESWQTAAARELFEETGIRAGVEEITPFGVHSNADGSILLVFGLARRRTTVELPLFIPNEETLERLVISGAEEMAFPLHTRAVSDYFSARR
jgi:ADP-ribose pyrophosphatase YjhB (NUDIX family)